MARAIVTVDDQSNLPDPVRTKLKGELDNRYAPVWQPSTAYATGAPVLLPAPVSAVGKRTSAGTSRSSFDATEQGLWTVTSGASTVDALTDATTVGKAVAKAANAGAARSAIGAPAATEAYAVLARDPEAMFVGTITRNANGVPTSAGVVWPDGTAGTFTADTVSTAFPGNLDAWHVTYGSPATKTYTQPAVTRNASGDLTAQPAIVVS